MRATSLAFAVALVAATGCMSSNPNRVTYLTIRDVEYHEGSTILLGHLAMPEKIDSPRPAVLVVHEWWGRGAHSDKSAEDLARLGYVGFAIDMYGDGASTTDPAKAGEWSGAIKKDRALGLRRFRAALDYVRSLPEVNPSRVAAIGYCFGGTVCLEEAWDGTALRGVVSFHGGLTTPTADQAEGVKASILVCHGADDPFAGKEVVDGFVKSMRDNKLDWEFVQYGGAVHSFTNPAADGSFNPGVKYNATAAARSWEVMTDFLAEKLR